MSRKFQVKAIPSAWLENNGRRLDCGPYMSGAVEAKELLKKHQTELLRDVTAGHNGGIFNGPRFPRIYVDDPEKGVPFLGSTDILDADLSFVSLLSKRQVEGNPALVLDEGWTLMTCSGTIGRMAYARSDMQGMAGSQHFMRVVPDAEKIKPGYLYAYLSSRFGVPIVVSGTYGAIIQHIEPHHIAGLPVPRLGDVEDKAHELNQRAADLRADANQMLLDAKNDLESEIAGGSVTWSSLRPQAFDIRACSVNSFMSRLDAFHYVGFVGEAIDTACVPLTEMGDYADVLRPPIMKRIRVTEGGHEFLGGTDLMSLDQRSDVSISARTPNIDKFIIKPGYVLFQCVGQRYGIFGRPVLANRLLIGKAVTEAVMRIIPRDPKGAGYISVYLATEFGRRLSMRFSAGSSIPVLQEEGARKILVYWPDEERRHEISRIAEQAWENRAQATELEDEARTLVERTIEEGGR
ncbi:methylation-associated defense system restriction endonuclease subunit S MAD5 [Thiolapillus sp.]|uniref:methylation-associated defense system restriction endonuclease subunit S MAD5 n=2 Tax=Thiolapillus sp. TaxID=2017437 RepID=UPI003AF46484